MNVKPQEYNYDERCESSWWFSRHRKNGNHDKRINRSQRIILIDLLLLSLMLGVLVPWFLRIGKVYNLGSYKVTLEIKELKGVKIFIFQFSPKKNLTELQNVNQIGIVITDGLGNVIYESQDIPSPEGEKRTFIFRDEKGLADMCKIYADSVSSLVDLTMNEN